MGCQIIYVMLFILEFSYAADVFLLEPASQPYLVREGNTSLTLPCVLKPNFFDQEKFEINWAHYNNGQLRILTKNGKLLAKKHSRFVLKNDAQTGNYSLIITEIEKNSVEGAYHCNVIAIDDLDVQYSALATVVVLLPPGDPVLDPSPRENILEGDFYSRKCTSTGGNPQPTFKWLLPNGTQADPMSYTTMFRDGITESLIHFQVAADDNGKPVQCIVNNEAMNATETKKAVSANLDVLYKPIIVTGPTENSTHLTVEEGETVDLTCDGTANPPPHSFEWKHIPSGERYQRRTWKIQANRSMGGVYECKAMNNLGESIASLNLVVQHKPIISVPKTISPNEMDDVSFHCEVEAIPKAFEIKWVGPNGFRMNGSQLFIKTISKDQSGNYTCLASNFLTIYGRSGSKQRIGSGTTFVDVKRKPGAARISVQHQSVDVGKTISLECHSDDTGNPSASYSWATPSSGELYNFEGHDQGTLVITNAQLSDNGMYSCKPHNELGEGKTATIKITVVENARISSPLATERIFSSGEQSKLLECEAQGYPTPVIAWLKNGHPVDETMKISTVSLDSKCDPEDFCIQTVTSSLLIPGPLKWSDKGNFTCVAENGSGMKHGNDSSWTLVRVLHKPVIVRKRHSGRALAAADIGSQSIIKCRVSARPEPQFHWSYGGTELVESEKHSFHTKTLNDKLDEYEQTLQIEHVNENDYGEYVCRVTNGNGGDNAITELRKTTLPATPNALHALSKTENSVLLGWEPQFDGGSNQTFLLDIKKIDPFSGETNNNDAEERLVADHVGFEEEYQVDGTVQSTTKYNLTGLTPLSSYYLRLLSMNDKGKSEFTPFIIVTTEDVKEDANMMGPARLIFNKNKQKLDAEPKLPAEACVLIYVLTKGVWRTTKCYSSSNIMTDIVSGREYKARFCTAEGYLQCSLFSKSISFNEGMYSKTSLLIPLVCIILVGLSLCIFFFVFCKTRVVPQSSKLCPIVLSPLPGEESKVREEFGEMVFVSKADRYQKERQSSNNDVHLSQRHASQSSEELREIGSGKITENGTREKLEVMSLSTEQMDNEEDLRIVREIIV